MAVRVVEFPTLAGYACEFSPYATGLIAVAASQYFGIIGNGKQLIYRSIPGSPQLQLVRQFTTQDGLYDCSWNESNSSQVVSASGDGSVKLFDLNTKDDFPIAHWHEHQTEVSGVHWNPLRKDLFLTASWDNTVKLFDPRRPKSLTTYAEHTYCVYQAIWSPRRPNVFASASGDGTVRIWDMNNPQSIHRVAPAHDAEVLTMDWNKYDENVIATGSVDRTVRIWDLRNPSMPMKVLPGHDFAVRRLKWSPHSRSILSTVSYDMTMCLWDISNQQSPLISRYEHHHEFVVGVDFNLFIPGEIATTSWDGYCTVWNFQDPNIRPPKTVKRNPNRPSLPLAAPPEVLERGNMKK